MPHGPASRQALWVAAVVAAIAAAAVLGPRLGRPTLRIAIHEGVEGVALKALAFDFSREKRVSVELFELPYDALYEAEMDAVSAEDPPYDVIMVDDPWLPALIGNGAGEATARLGEFVFDAAECASFGLHDFVPSTLRVSLHPEHPEAAAPSGVDAATRPFTCDRPFDGLYALPFVGNSQLFLTRPGVSVETWEQVLPEDGGDRRNSGYVTRVGAGNSIVTDFMPILWTLSPRAGEARLSLASAVAPAPAAQLFDPEQTTRAFQFIHALGAAPDANRGVVSVDDFDLAIHLVEGRASMMVAWSAWVMAIARLSTPDGMHLFELHRRGTPAFEVTRVPGGQPVLGAWLLALPGRARHLALAREFVLFATAKEQIDQAAARGNPPPRISTLRDGRWRTTYPFFPQQLESLQHARARPRTPHWRAIETALGDCLTALYENTIKPDAAFARVQDRLARIATPEEFSCQQPLNP